MADIVSQTGINIVWTDPLWFSIRRAFGTITKELESYSHTLGADKGFVDAAIGLSLPRDQMEDWYLNGLGRDIIVRNSGGTVIFRGFVDQVDMSIAGIIATIGPLRQVANRVYCVYNPLFVLPTQSSSSGQIEAPAIENAASQARYGVWEYALNAGNCLVDPATGYNEAAVAQALYLFQNQLPKQAWSTTNTGSIDLKLTVRGYYEWFGAYLYQNRTITPATSTLTAYLTAVLAANLNTDVISAATTGIGTNASLILDKTQDYSPAISRIDSVLAAGDGAGGIWLARLDKDNRLIYAAADETPYYLYSVLDNRQTVLRMNGDAVKPWDILPGKVAFLHDWMMGVTGPPGDLGVDPRVALVDQVRYTAPWSFELASREINQFQAFVNRKGLGGY